MSVREDMILKNGLIIDGTGRDPIRNASIVVIEGKVKDILLTDEKEDSTLKIIDLKELTILPGFINTHAHTGFKYIKDQLCSGFHEKYLKSCIYEGITTIRDEGMLSDTSIAEMIVMKNKYNNTPEYPRIITTGKYFSAPGGYGGQAPIGISTVDDAKLWVKEVFVKGIDLIKAALEDGMDPSTFGLPKLSEELLRTICEEAHQHGKKVSAHVSQVHNLQKLVNAGINDAAHMVADEIPDSLLLQMIEQNVYIVPTLTVLKFIQEKWLQGNATILESGMNNVKGFIKAGGKIALGDDFVEENLPWYRLGMPLLEIELLSQAGLSPMQIITAATKHGAIVCDKEQEIGTIEVDKTADFLIIEGNPLEDILNIKNVKMVFKEGFIVRQ